MAPMRTRSLNIANNQQLNSLADRAHEIFFESVEMAADDKAEAQSEMENQDPSSPKPEDNLDEGKKVEGENEIDKGERELIETYRLGFALLRDTTMALQGSTQEDISARLNSILSDVGSIPDPKTDIIDVDLILDEAAKIRHEMAFRSGQKARTRALERKLELTEADLTTMTITNKLLRRENDKLKQLLKARAKASVKLLSRSRALYVRYEELQYFAENLVSLTKETILAGQGLENERDGLDGRLNFEGF